MIFLALDEQGDFEYIKKNHKDIMFIGGIIYDDNNISDDIDIEKKRIKAYYKSVCSEYSTDKVKLSYPHSLHSAGNNNNEVALAKNGVSETIKEFLMKGTFKGKALVGTDGKEFAERQGKYYPYLFIKSANDKEQFSIKNNDLLYEKKSSNIYYHMVRDTLNRMLCQCDEFCKTDDYYFQIATRSTPPFPLNDVRRGDYEKNKYEIITKDGNGNPLLIKDKDGNDIPVFRVQLTNRDVYRTVFREIVTQNEMFNTNIQWLTKSIVYKSNVNNSEFLYLADSICSLFSYDLVANNATEQFEAIQSRVIDVIDENQMLLFAYDTVDDYYSKAYSNIKEKDYYKALEQIYYGYNRNDVYAVYYREKHFKKLEEKIVEEFDVKGFEQAILNIERNLKSNTYEIGKSKFIVDHLLELIDKGIENRNTSEFNVTLFKLYNAAISAYSHIGDPIGAHNAYNKALRYSYYASLEEFLQMRNKMVVFLTDTFKYEDALEIAKMNVGLQDEVASLKERLVVLLPADGYLERSKANSQLGQTYAFMRNGEAEKYFKDALNSMKKRSANYFITKSYLLHFYIDQGRKEEYVKHAKEFFGGYTDLEEQFEYLKQQGKEKDPLISVSFGLYVFMKALYKFHSDEISESLWEKLCDIKKNLKKNGKNYEFRDHPDELSLKYMILLAIQRGTNEKIIKRFNKQYNECLNGQEVLVNCIWLFGKICIQIQQDGFDSVAELINELWQKMGETFDVVDLDDPRDVNDKWNVLNNLLVYMYV